jgi:hypothetical protein
MVRQTVEGSFRIETAEVDWGAIPHTVVADVIS